jgi:GAF domain-containing protein
MIPRTLTPDLPQGPSYSIAELDLIDAPAEEGYDAITRLAMRLFKVPVALISIIDETRERQFFKSQVGLPEPWASRRETPLTHSFCQHVKAQASPLIVPFAPNHPLVCDNLAIRDLNVISYLGVPIFAPDGTALGALCVIDGIQRDWTEDDVSLLGDLAKCVIDEIALRAAFRTNAMLYDRLQASHQRISRYTALRESIVMGFMAPDLGAEDRFNALLRAGCQALGLTHGAIARITGSKADVVFSVHPQGTGAIADPVNIGRGLCGSVTSGTTIIHRNDLATSDLARRTNLFGHIPGCFIAAPIHLNGVLCGVLEFSGDQSRPAPWDEEELSMISIVAMFAAAHMALHGEIAALKRSEMALIGSLLDSKRQTIRFSEEA